jgi:hypothetical protein
MERESDTACGVASLAESALTRWVHLLITFEREK